MKLPPPAKFPHATLLALSAFLVAFDPASAQPVTEDLAAERDGSGRPTGRLNHPILLVHGYGTNSESFGVDFGDETCLQPGLTATPDSRYTTNGSWLVLESRLPLQCANGWTPQWVRRDSLVKFDAPFFARSAIPEQPPVSNPSTRSTSAIGRTFLWDDWLREATNRRLIHLDSVVPFRIKRAEHVAHDRLMSYHPNSIPGVLARTFGLDTTWNPTTPDSGINANGIHVFNARWQTKYVKERCPAPQLLVNWTRLEWVPSAASTRIGQMDFAVYTIRFTADGTISCPGSGWAPETYRMVVDAPGRTKPGVPGTPIHPYTESRWFAVPEPTSRAMHLIISPEAGTPSSRMVSHTFYGWSDTSKTLFTTTTSIPALNGDQPLDTGTARAPGQPRQLLERMRSILDRHYGAQRWTNDPTAQIDLVAHSQGGVVIRAMLAEPSTTSDTTLANPLRHIRRVVTLGTPHFGTAAATSPSILRQQESDLDASLGQRRYPALADLREAIANTGSCELPELPTQITRNMIELFLNRIHSQLPGGCLLIHAPLPYTVDKPLDPVLDLYPHGEQKDGTYTGRLVLFGPKAGPWRLRFLGFDGVNLVDKPISLDGVTRTLKSMASASHLAWPLTTIDPIKSDTTYNKMETLRRLDARYPRYPGSEAKIPFHTFTSATVGNFTQDVFSAALENLKAGCPVDARDRIWYARHKLFVMTKTSMGVDGTGSSTCIDFRHAMDVWAQQARAQFAPLDLDWSQAGDMVVEAPSQSGAQRTPPGSTISWNIQASNVFHPTSFEKSSILHGITPIRMSFASINPGQAGLDWRLRAPDLDIEFPSGPLEGCDVVARGLGVAAPLGCSSSGHPVSPTASSLLRVPAPSGGWALIVRNPTSRPWLAGWSLELPVQASSKPSPRLEGSTLLPEVSSNGEASWIARFVFPEKVAARSPFHPESAPLVFTPGADASFPVADLVGDSSIEHLAILREITGQVRAGISSADDAPSDILPVGIQVSRSAGDNAWLRPSLRIHNQGSDTLRSLQVLIMLPGRPDGLAPEAALWNTPWPARGTLSVQREGSDWRLTLVLDGLDLAPGEVLDDLRFGVHWPDWTPWTTPSLPDVPNSVHWIQATRNVSEPAATIPTTPASLRLEGRRERPDPNLHVLRLRVTSPANTTGFRVRLPLEDPTGLDPVLEAWWPQGCQGTIGTGQLELSCPTASLQARTPWPDSTGAAIGIHDRNWTPWPVGATGITALQESWSEVSP